MHACTRACALASPSRVLRPHREVDDAPDRRHTHREVDDAPDGRHTQVGAGRAPQVVHQQRRQVARHDGVLVVVAPGQHVGDGVQRMLRNGLRRAAARVQLLLEARQQVGARPLEHRADVRLAVHAQVAQRAHGLLLHLGVCVAQQRAHRRPRQPPHQRAPHLAAALVSQVAQRPAAVQP
eukprot:352348-Chlamydomonas_euryale.AAC.5